MSIYLCFFNNFLLPQKHGGVGVKIRIGKISGCVLSFLFFPSSKMEIEEQPFFVKVLEKHRHTKCRKIKKMWAFKKPIFLTFLVWQQQCENFYNGFIIFFEQRKRDFKCPVFSNIMQCPFFVKHSFVCGLYLQYEVDKGVWFHLFNRNTILNKMLLVFLLRKVLSNKFS
jgi:hypothetical protein